MTIVKKKTGSQKLKELIGFVPHEKQMYVLAHQKRFTILDAGRRWGKTILVAYLALKYLLMSEKKIWAVAPTYVLAEKVWNYLMKYITKFPEGTFNIERSRLRITCKITGSVLECKSADNPESLLGEGLDFIIFDEASKVDNGDIWEQYLKPTLLDRKGSIIFISTPTGKNWFWRIWVSAKGKPDWARFQYASHENPHLDPEELKEIEKNTPEMIWRQEWLAQFIEGAGQVFREVRACIFGSLIKEAVGYASKDRFRYVIGWDLAKVHDYSVVIVVDKALRQVVHFDRFKDLDWEIQKNRVKKIADKFGKGKIIMDATNNDSLVKDLQRDGYAVEGIRYNSSIKKELIVRLQMKLEKWEIRYPEIKELVEELESFTIVLSHAGNMKYTAPAGMHDDCVNALALAVAGMGELRYNPPYEDTEKYVSKPAMRYHKVY